MRPSRPRPSPPHRRQAHFAQKVESVLVHQNQVRLRILEHLAGAKALKASYFPRLRQILRNDPDDGMRAAALELLRAIKDWDGNFSTQLLWTAGQDADPALRARQIEPRGAGGHWRGIERCGDVG